MGLDCCQPKRNSRRDGIGHLDSLLSDGYLFERLNKKELASARRVEKSNLIALSEFEYVRCVNPLAGDPDVQETINSACTGIIPIASTEDVDICPVCGRSVFLDGKKTYTGWRSRINHAGCLCYLANVLSELAGDVKELTTGVFRCANGINELHIIVWDCCSVARYKSHGFASSNPCLYIIVDGRKWSNRIPGTLQHILLRDIFTSGSGILREAINKAGKHFDESHSVQSESYMNNVPFHSPTVARTEYQKSKHPVHGKLILEDTPRGPTKNGMCAQLSGTALKEKKQIGIRQFFFLYHIFTEGVDIRCDNISCTGIDEKTLESRFIDWVQKQVITHSSKTGKAEPAKHRIQKMWGQCKRQLDKIPELNGLFFEWKNTSGIKHFGIKMMSEEISCHIRYLEKLLEDSKSASEVFPTPQD